MRLRLGVLAWIGLVVQVFVIGCDRSSTKTPPSAGAPQATGSATTQAAAPSLRDDFEQDAIASFWLPGNYGSGLYERGAVKLSSKYHRSGGHSVEITVHEGDIAQAGDGNTEVERAELDSGHFALRNGEAWYGFSFLVPPGFPIIDHRLVISSCKQSDVSRPIIAERFRNGKHTLTIESHGGKKEYRLAAIRLGQWMDVIFHVRYASNDSGLVEVWVDGKQQVSYAGPTAEDDAKNAFYHKIGLYRDRLKEPMTIYFDSYAMGSEKSALAPLGGDR